MARWVLAGAVLAVSVVVLVIHGRTTDVVVPGEQKLTRRIGVSRRPPAPVRRVVIGYSVRGRPLVARELGSPRARRKVLVVGCIHGDERAGIEVIDRLRTRRPPRDADLWMIADLNPDGAAAGTRQNARGVDLNRNFPFAWRPLGRRGDQQYSGPHPLSEPEARAARTFILRLRPDITVWFHQPLGVVDESGGSVAIERRFARTSGLPLRRLQRYPGSVASWQDYRLAGTTAFVVELGSGRPAIAPIVRAVLALG